MDKPKPAYEFFAHDKNLQVGHARILYSEETETRTAGWRLHGGLSTTDRLEAHAYAVRVNRLISGY